MKCYVITILLFSLNISMLFAQDNYTKIEGLWKDQISLGEEQYKEKKFMKALNAYDSAIRIIPTDTLAYIQAAVCAYNLGYYNQSKIYISDFSTLFKYTSTKLEDLLEGIVKIAEEDTFIAKAEAMFEKTQTLLETGEFEKALIIIAEAEKLFPDQYDTFAKLELNVYMQQQDFGKLETRMVALAKNLPNDLDINYNLGVMYEQNGELDKAIFQYEKVVKIAPDNFSANYNSGIYYYNNAAKILLETNDLDSAEYAQKGLSMQEDALSSFFKAKPYFENCILLNQDDIDSYQSLHATLSYVKNLNFNIETLRSIGEIEMPDDIEIESPSEIKDTDITTSDEITDVIVINEDENTEKEIVGKVEEKVEEKDDDIIEGVIILGISGLHFEYENDASFLKKGDKGVIKFYLENYGVGTAVDLTVNVIQPIAVAGLNYQRKIKIERLQPEEKQEIEITVTYDEPLTSRGFKKIIAVAESKIKILVKDSKGNNTGMQEFSLSLNDEKNTAVIAKEIKPAGKNYLIIMGCDNYSFWPKLNNAVKDAKDVKTLLLEKYSFKEDDLYELYNEDFTASNIRKTIISLKERITPEDNLVIYYSGHGYYDELFKEGYWIPFNAQAGVNEDYFSNNALHQFLKIIDTKHIFMVVDACFSGSLFSDGHRGANFASKVEQYKSRWGLSSGNLTVVSDGKPGENSPFCSYFLKYLKINREPVFPVSEIIQYVKISVSENSNQMPIGSPLKNLGHEGGEYVFHLK